MPFGLHDIFWTLSQLKQTDAIINHILKRTMPLYICYAILIKNKIVISYHFCENKKPNKSIGNNCHIFRWQKNQMSPSTQWRVHQTKTDVNNVVVVSHWQVMQCSTCLEQLAATLSTLLWIILWRDFWESFSLIQPNVITNAAAGSSLR